MSTTHRIHSAMVLVAVLVGIAVIATGGCATVDEQQPMTHEAVKTAVASKTVKVGEAEHKPVAVARPKGEYDLNCDYILKFSSESSDGSDHHRFVGGGTIQNVGNVGIKVRVTYKWQLLGESPLKLQRTYRVSPGVSRDISISTPASGEQIDAHQSADDRCSSKAKIIGTEG